MSYNIDQRRGAVPEGKGAIWRIQGIHFGHAVQEPKWTHDFEKTSEVRFHKEVWGVWNMRIAL